MTSNSVSLHSNSILLQMGLEPKTTGVFSTKFHDQWRTVEIIVGNVYQISPLNPKKTKYRNRVCTVQAFYIRDEDWSWDHFSPSQVCVKFHDTKREGVVEIIDLIPFEEKNLENELEQARLEIKYLKQQNADLRAIVDLLKPEGNELAMKLSILA